MFRALRPFSISTSRVLTTHTTRSPSAFSGSAVAKQRLHSLASHFSTPASATTAPTPNNSKPSSRETMATLGSATKKHKVTIVGSGNWGTTMAKIVAENVKAHSQLFEEQVQMWVYEEEVTIDKKSRHYDASSPLCQGPQKLSKVINELHENVKYLPNITLPANVIANPSLDAAARDSTLLVFVIPHQFIARICDRLKGKILPFARGISCTKGVDVSDKGIQLFSESIGARLGIYCGALSGANIATEIAQEKYSETTVAYDPPPIDSRQPSPTPSPSQSTTDLISPNSKSPSEDHAIALHPLPIDYPPLSHENVKKLFHRPYFHVRMVSDVAGVSLGGALKNVVALAAGFVDGLGWGDNAKAAVMRVGLLEMVKFGTRFFASSCQPSTFTEESCGMADVVTSCMGGRNFRCAKRAIERGMSVEDVEKAELNGQKLQGTSTAYEVHSFLESQGMVDEFPLFTAVYNILEGNTKAEEIPELIEPKE